MRANERCVHALAHRYECMSIRFVPHRFQFLSPQSNFLFRTDHCLLKAVLLSVSDKVCVRRVRSRGTQLEASNSKGQVCERLHPYDGLAQGLQLHLALLEENTSCEKACVRCVLSVQQHNILLPDVDFVVSACTTWRLC